MTDGEVRDTPAGRGRLVVQSRLRAAVARQMAESKRSVPHFYVSAEIVMDPLLDALRRLAQRQPGGLRVSATAGMIRAVAGTLRDHAAFNSVATDEGFVLVDSVNVGVAIALENGLVAPALLDCGRLDLLGVAAALDDLVARTKTGRLRTAEMSGATFTLSNLGMFEVSSFAAIIPPPQVAILATGRAVRRPVIEDEAVGARSVMTATLSADHRAVDGAQAARFLGTFRERLAGVVDEALALL